MENNQTTEPTSKSVNVSQLMNDEGFRKLPLNSEAFANAVNGNEAESAPANEDDQRVAEDETGEDEVLAEQQGNDEQSDDDKVPDSVRSRFKRLTQARDSAELRVEELERKLARYEAGQQPEATKGAEGKAQPANDGPEFVYDKPEPDPKDFKDVAGYTKALSRYESEKFYAETKWREGRETAVKTGQQKIESFFNKGKNVEKELGLRDGEFALYMRDPKFPLSVEARDVAFESELGARVLFEIASNGALKEQFGKMTALQQVNFIGKLEAKFETKSEPQGGNKKTAAKPIGPALKGSAATPSSLKGKPLNSITETVKSQKEFRKVAGME